MTKEGSGIEAIRPRIGVVMSGGGLKPLAALPLFDFLEREGIAPDLLVGCSGGGIIAAMRGAGYCCDEIRDIIFGRVRPGFFKKDWRTVLGMLHLPFGRFDRTAGLFKPDSLLEFLESIFQQRRLEDLSTETILQSTDFETGEGVNLVRGRLDRAAYASSAIFPFFPAIQFESRWLFDGLYSGPLPLLTAINKNMDIIIAIEFMEKIQKEPKGFYECMVHLNKLFTKTIMQSQTAVSISLHHYEIIYIKVMFEKYISIWDTESMNLILHAGKTAVEKNISHIVSAFQNWERPSADA